MGIYITSDDGHNDGEIWQGSWESLRGFQRLIALVFGLGKYIQSSTLPFSTPVGERTALYKEAQAEVNRRAGGILVLTGLSDFLFSIGPTGFWYPDDCEMVRDTLIAARKINDLSKYPNHQCRLNQFIRGLNYCVEHNQCAGFA